MLNTILLNAETTAQNQASASDTIYTIVIWVLIFAVLYFLLLRPKTKKQKEDEKMRANIEIGDDITTIGGIVGRIVSIRDEEDSFLIETGPDKQRMKIKKWAVSTVDTQKELTSVDPQEKTEKKKFSLFKKKDKEQEKDTK